MYISSRKLLQFLHYRSFFGRLQMPTVAEVRNKYQILNFEIFPMLCVFYHCLWAQREK
jgi:hypothetical protein